MLVNDTSTVANLLLRRVTLSKSAGTPTQKRSTSGTFAEKTLREYLTALPNSYDRIFVGITRYGKSESKRRYTF